MISVIIPTYNRENTIIDSVNSVLHQTYKDLEVIVVDDGSTDATQSLLDSINDKRIRYILQDHKGANAARNVGIKAATGEYIAFHDSDDICRPNKLERQLQTLIENNCDVVFCAINRCYLDSNKKFPEIESGIKSFEDILMGFYASTQTLVGKSEVFKDVPFDEKVKRLQDYDLMIRVAMKYKVCYLNEALVDTYLQSNSITIVEGSFKKSISTFENILIKYPEIADLYPDWKLNLLKKIAFFKTKQKVNVPEYVEIFKLEKSFWNLLSLILSKTPFLAKLFENYKYVKKFHMDVF